MLQKTINTNVTLLCFGIQFYVILCCIGSNFPINMQTVPLKSQTREKIARNNWHPKQKHDSNLFSFKIPSYKKTILQDMETKQILRTISYIRHTFENLNCLRYICHLNFQKSVNLQYNTLVRLADGTNDLSTKCLMFQVQCTPDLVTHLVCQKTVTK